MQLNEFTLVRLDKIVNPSKHFFNKSKHFIQNHFPSSSICECLICHQHQLHYNLHQNHRHNQILFFFILSADQSVEMFPKHNGVAIISESFALNL